jgi:predicted secreted protein
LGRIAETDTEVAVRVALSRLVVLVAKTLALLRRMLRDERSGRVVFVSHCLLNQNVRYLGGATRAGACQEQVAAWLAAGLGVVQMPCPEQYAWGGVCKRFTMPAYGADSTIPRWLRRPSTWLFLAYTRWAYRHLAGRVAAQISDYVRSGYQVTAVVGIGGSPSCGVRVTLDLPAVLDDLAARDPARLTREELNQHIIAGHARAGEGMFIAALRQKLRRRAIDVPFDEHSLIAEITSDPGTSPTPRSAWRTDRVDDWRARPGTLDSAGPGIQ